jgi:phosphoribosyl 1,2-cyclic phosphodiesterase
MESGSEAWIIDPSWREETDIIFIGTGSSGGTPKLTCLTKADQSQPCLTCFDAVKPGSPNNRRNTSLLIRTRWYQNDNPGSPMMKDRYILIDCGKSFMQSAIAHFPTFGVTRLDAVLLTHAHADACFGMDDLRALTGGLPKGHSIPVYLRQQDLDVLKGPFGYLMPDANHTRFVASISFRVFDPSLPLNIMGLDFLPLPVEHGAGYTSLGYAFDTVVYISDLNKIYESTQELLKSTFKYGVLPKDATQEQRDEHKNDPRKEMSIFVIDALFPEEHYPSHYSLTQAIDEAKIWRPKHTLTVGMAHQLNHQRDNEKLKSFIESDGLLIELAFDGQRLTL